MPYSGQHYEFLFTQACGDLTEDVFETLRHRNVPRYRTKTIRSGEVVEVEIFPIWNTKSEARAARTHTTRDAQRNLNERNTKRRLTRTVNANFTREDLHVTLTYADGCLPDEKQARKDIRNFLKRVRDYRRRNGLSELKYVYVIEFCDGDGRRTRVHHHVILSGMDRDILEDMWGKGDARAHRLKPEDGTLEGLAKYITKQPSQKQSKRWAASRNLKKPKVTVSDTKLSRRQAERLASDVNEAAPEIFRRLFPECTFDECAVKSSEFVAGAYIYARLHRTPAPGRRKREIPKRL